MPLTRARQWLSGPTKGQPLSGPSTWNIPEPSWRRGRSTRRTGGIEINPGHLCSVTYPEAVSLGIDDLEHGFFVNTQLDPGKQPDNAPTGRGTRRCVR